MGFLRLVPALALLACNAPREAFECSSNTSCRNSGMTGTCESTGFCSFPDPTCAMGSRYGTAAGGGLAGLCVGTMPGGDGGGSADAPYDGNDNAAPHMLGAWAKSVTMSLPRHSFTTALDGDFLYVLAGINGSTVHTDVQFATLNPTAILPGAAIATWTTTTALPEDNRTGGAAYDSGYLYIFGGRSGAPSDTADVLSAPVDGAGNVGAWTQQAPLAESLRCPLVASSGHYVYVIGGKNGATPRANVFRGILSGGTVTWNLETTLDVTVYNGEAVAANGYLYVIGGCATLGCGTILDIVEVAKINADGTLGAFQHTSSLPKPVTHHSAAAASGNGDIYVVGGKYSSATSGSETSDVVAAHQHTDGTLGPWTPVTSLIDATIKGRAAIVGKFLYYIDTESQVVQIQ